MLGSKRILAVIAAALLVGATGVGALLYVNRTAPAKGSEGGEANSVASPFATGSLAKLRMLAEPQPATGHVFLDPQGREMRLDAFRGRVAVVNLWAMWCPPCRLEMPTLAALAGAYSANPDLAVVVVNVDVGDEQTQAARSFLADHAPLAFYSDPKFQLPFEFGGRGGMPQTVLIDRQGRVRALMTGEADWASPEARAIIDALLAED